MKLRTKLLLALLLAAVVPLAGASFYTLNRVSEAFISKEIDILESVNFDKSNTIASYFHEIEQQLEQIAFSEKTIDAMAAFSGSFDSAGSRGDFIAPDTIAQQKQVDTDSLRKFYREQFLEGLTPDDRSAVSLNSLLPRTDAGIRLQSLYISENQNPLGSKNSLYHAEDNSQYSNIHSKYHNYFNSFLERYGYYDIFLVEPTNGNIVYSVYKEVDYATSLINGPHADSGIGRAFRQAVRLSADSDNVLIDYSFYLPSYNAPALFTSRPIVKDGVTIGVLIFQVPMDKVNSVISEVVGLGETGKAYVYSSADGLLRSQLPGKDENTVLAPAPTTEGTATAINNNGYASYADYNGNQVEAFVKSMPDLGLDWFVVTEQNSDEAFAKLSLIKKIYLYTFVVSLLVAIGVAFWLLRNIRNQLGAEPDFLETIATEIADGDLTRDFSNLHNQSGTLKTMVSMQKTLKERDRADRETLTHISQLKDGLQKLNTPVALASGDHQITFINTAMEELLNRYANDFRSVNSSFDPRSIIGSPLSQFSASPSDLQSRINSLTGVYECEFVAGSRIFNLVFNAMYSDSGERVGSSVEWQDITVDRLVMDEVDDVVTKANQGCLTARVNETGKKGIYLSLTQGINGLLDVNQKFVADVSEFLSAVSGGDLTRTIKGDYQGALADVKRDADVTVEKLMDVVYNIRSVAGTVNSAASEINSGNIDLSRRTELAAASLEETSSSMVEMTESVLKNAEHSKQAKTLALNAMGYAQKGGEVVGEAVSAMGEINESSRMISDIIGVIDDIAFQTNLLALNASVEAARAGEQGRGFAVVASEVRNLAGRSATAAKEIKELIEDSVQRVGKGAELVNQSGKTLDHIVAEVKKVADVVSEISEASQEQSDGIGSVSTAIGQLDEATQQNAALVEEASAASQSASEQARSLIKMIEFFATSEQGAGSTGLDNAENRKLRVVQ